LILRAKESTPNFSAREVFLFLYLFLEGGFVFKKRNILLSLVIILVLALAAASRFLPSKDQQASPDKIAQEQKTASASSESTPTPDSGTTKGESISPNFRLETRVNPTPQAPVTKPIARTVSLQIKGNTELSFKVNWTSGMTVWDVLDKADKENDLDLIAKWNDFLDSYYVTGIAGTNCECWKYSVNGVEPPKGSSLVAVSENDIIIWKKI
jgi:hypothetical protein